MYVFMYVYTHAYIHSQAIHIATWPSNYTYMCIYLAIMYILGNTHSAIMWLSLTTESQNKDHHLAS